MRFQGENCTLSFGLHFDRGQVLVNGMVWFRRLAPPVIAQDKSPRLRFATRLAESDLLELQQWLTAKADSPLSLPNPVRYLRRLDSPTDEVAHLELELTMDQVPPWWNWAVSFPLKIHLEIRSNEFAYLINSLNRENWTTNLTW